MYVPEGKGLKARSKALAANAESVRNARVEVLSHRHAAAVALMAKATKKSA